MASSGQAFGYSTPSQFFVTGGTMRLTAPSYVERAADADLYRTLARGDFCYLLDTRQMGKSSMMARVAKRLRGEGAAVAIVDLQNLGQSLTIEQWYYAQLSRIGDALDLEDEVDEFWSANEKAAPVNRWVRTIEEVLLPAVPGRLVVFIDEIDFVRSLPFPTDEFFAAIRGFHNGRAVHGDLNRLTFCLLGVATPTDLIRREELTPFNVGRRIDLADFSEQEVVDGFAAGLNRPQEMGQRILKRVWYWTEGHPYLTQKLAEACAEDGSVESASGVDAVCRSLFLASGSREQNDNLRFVANRMLAPDVDAASVLDLYRKVRSGETVPDDGTNPLVNVLRLSGIAKVVNGGLRVRNPIYVSVFDDAWVDRNIPDQELRRQQEVYHRAQRRTALVALGVAALIGLVAYAALLVARNRELNKKNDEIIRETRRAQSAETLAKQQAARAEEASERALSEAAKARAAEATATRERTVAEQRRLEAEKASETARRAEASAMSNAADAQKQREVAVDALKQAELARVRAEASERKLKDLTTKLAQDSKVASTLRLASRSETERSQSSSSIEPSVLLAIESLGRMWSIENYPALLEGMALTPRHEGLKSWEHPMSKTVYPSSDGSVLVGVPAAANNRLCQWRINPPTELCTTLPGRNDRFMVSNDGRYVWAIASSGAKYWDTTQGPDWVDLNLPAGAHFFVPSPDGTEYATADDKETVVVRSFPGSKLLFSIHGKAGRKSGSRSARELHPIQFAGNGKHLLIFEPGAGGGSYHLWDVQLRREMFEMSARADPVLGPDAESAFVPRAGELAKPEASLALKLLRDRAAHGRPLFPVLSRLFSRSGTSNGPMKTKTLAAVPTIRAYAYSPDGRLFAAATPDSVVVWQVASGAQVPLPQTDNVSDLAFSPDSSMLALASPAHETARVFDAHTYQELARVRHSGISRSGFNRNGTLVTVSTDRAEVWQSSGWRGVASLGRSAQPPHSVLFSRTSDAAAFFAGAADSTAADNTLTIRDLSSGNVIRRLIGGMAFTQPQFSADGRRLAVLTGDGRVMVFDTATGRKVGGILLPDSYSFVRLSPDGNRILAVRNNRYMRIEPLNLGPVEIDGGQRGSAFLFAGAGRVVMMSPEGIHEWNVDGGRVANVALRNWVRVAAADNGRYLLVMTRRSTFRSLEAWLWEPGRNKATRLGWPVDAYTAIRLNSTGELAAVNGPKGWSIRRLPGGEEVYAAGPARTIQFRSDGKMIAVALTSGAIQVVDLVHSQKLGSIPAETGREVTGFSGSGDVVTKVANKLEFWDPVTGNRGVARVETKEPIRNAMLTPDGRFAAIIEAPQVARSRAAPDDLRVTDLKRGGAMSVRFPSTVTAAAFSADDKYLAAASLDGTVKMIERSSGREITVPPSLEIEATSLAFDEGSRYVASAGGQTVRLWGVTDTTRLWANELPDRVVSIAFGGNLLAALCSDGILRLLRVPDLTEARSVRLGSDVRSVEFSGNGKWMAAIGEGSVEIRDTGSWSPVSAWKQPALAGAVFSPASNYLVAFDGNGSARLWNARGPLVVELPKFDSPLTGAAFGAGEKQLLVGTSGGVRIMDLGSLAEIGRVPVAGKVAAIGVSPDGRYLAIANTNGGGTVTYWAQKDLIVQACSLLTRTSLTAEERNKYLLPGESYVDFCAHPEKIGQ